jgi:guanylate kinase
MVLSGPSGVGKDAVLSRMRALGKPFHFTVTTTTRPRRECERDGVDYTFVTAEEFNRMAEGGELLEWAQVYGNLYGVPRDQVRGALARGLDVVIKTDVQGAATIRTLAPEAVFIFLAPPTIEELGRRLGERMTEDPDTLALRLATAEQEMAEASRFDYVVVNHDDRLDDAVAEIESIVSREGRRIPARHVAI